MVLRAKQEMEISKKTTRRNLFKKEGERRKLSLAWSGREPYTPLKGPGEPVDMETSL